MRRILVVDGAHDSLSFLHDWLEAHHYGLDTASDGAAALRHARRFPPEIIISELRMPVMDGFELLRQWQADPQLQDIPFVIYADASSEPGDAQRALELGAADFIVKSVEPPLLLARVQAVLAQSGRLDLQNKTLSLAQANRDLLESEIRLRAIVAAEPECVKLLAADGTLLEMNPAGLQMIEADSFQQVANQNLYSLVRAEHQAAFRKLTENVFRGESGTLEFQITGLKGARRWLETHAAPLRDAYGRVTALLGITRDITEHKRMTVALQESEQRLRNIFDTMFVFVGLVTLDGILIEVNKAPLEVAGLKREEVLGRPVTEMYWFAHSAVTQEQVRRALSRAAQGEIVREEYSLQGTDGQICTIDATFAPLCDSSGRVTQIVGSAVDVTVRKRVENAVMQKTLQLQTALHMANMGVWSWDMRSGEMIADAGHGPISGLPPADHPQSRQDFSALIHPDDRTIVGEQLEQALTGQDYNPEFRIVLRNGDIHWVAARGRCIRDVAGVPIILTGLDQDITERKVAEIRIRQLNRTYTVLSDINQLIVRAREPQLILDSACRIAVEQGGFLLAWIGWTDAATGGLQLVAHTGASPDTMVLLNTIFSNPQLGCAFTAQALKTGTHAVCNDIAHDSLATPWREAALQRGYRSLVSLPLTLADGRHGAFNLYAAEAGFFDAEELRLLDELASDITFALDGCARDQERQRALEQLRTSEERFRLLAETIEDVFWISELAQNRLIYISPGYERVWGRSCQSLYDEPNLWLESVHPDDRERVRQVSLLAQQNTVDEEYRIIRTDGAVRTLRAQTYLVHNDAGQVERLVGVARDITERRQMSDQLRQSQKMEAIGQLASGIAHDFNNLLATIIGNAELAQLNLGSGEVVGESIQEIRRAGERAKQLVQRILTFGRPHDQQLIPVQLRSIIDEAVRLLRSILPAGVAISLLDGRAVPVVRADASQVHQIILNLATNAWHAMGTDIGRITLNLDACRVDSGMQQAHPELQPGPYIRLSVSDTGKGMDAATIERIFEPFFTTKLPGQGTGLGLSMVHGIMRSHDGAIIVESYPGRGSTFHLYFPAHLEMKSVDEVVTTLAASLPTTAPGGHGEHILYLDDDESLVYLNVRLLERRGYRVTGRTQAAEALADFRANPSSFDLIITDMNMPGISGLDVAQQLLSIDPDALIVLASGYLRPAEIEQARLVGVREVILKPNTVEELGPIVQRLMAARSGASVPGAAVNPASADF